MEKEFIPFEEAKALKELGFNEKCITHFSKEGGFNDYVEDDDMKFCGDIKFDNHMNIYATNGKISAPLYQQAFDWFLEKHHLWFRPDYPFDDKNTYGGNIHKIGLYSLIGKVKPANTDRDARLNALKLMIDLIK